MGGFHWWTLLDRPTTMGKTGLNTACMPVTCNYVRKKLLTICSCVSFMSCIVFVGPRAIEVLFDSLDRYFCNACAGLCRVALFGANEIFSFLVQNKKGGGPLRSAEKTPEYLLFVCLFIHCD